VISKWCRIQVGDEPRYALVQGAQAVLLDAPPFADHRGTGEVVGLAQAVFLPPVEPRNFYAAGLNYVEHVRWAVEHHQRDYRVPTTADPGLRSPSALVGSGFDIHLPADSTGSFEWEGELVAVIGKRARHVSEEDALGYVAGYTLGNDLSERAWQFEDRTLWRSKNSDTFKPMGPYVVSGIDPMNQDIEVRINEKAVSRYNTRGMVFSVAHFISRISQYATLHPGDVLWFGCDGATVPGLQPGDVVEVRNEFMGELKNRVVRDA